MNLHHVYVNRNETMQPKSLHEQLREIEEKIAEEFSQDLKGERISDQFNEWRKKRLFGLCGGITTFPNPLL